MILTNKTYYSDLWKLDDKNEVDDYFKDIFFYAWLNPKNSHNSITTKRVGEMFDDFIFNKNH